MRRLFRILKTPTLDLKVITGPKHKGTIVSCTICAGLAKEKPDYEGMRFVLDKIGCNCFRDNTEEDSDLCHCKGFKTVCLKSVFYTNDKYRDTMIKIALLCKEIDISNFVTSLDDMSELFNRYSPEV